VQAWQVRGRGPGWRRRRDADLRDGHGRAARPAQPATRTIVRWAMVRVAW